MENLKKLGVVCIVSSAALLFGCSSSSSDGGGSSDDSISGTVSAPAGTVAMFEHKNAFQVAMEFLVTPVAAGITGLEPVSGATVELIRIDDNGDQVGDVLATTTTSITGEYKLTLPAGTDLSGSLIVRITGTGAAEMRAQVVEKEVDITPVSEFVLQSFIDAGTDLDTLSTSSVIKLTGQVEEFDLTAGADLSEMLALLEEETGDFVDAQIDVIASEAGDASAVTGAYRNAGIQFGLHDDDGQYGVGTFSAETWNTSISMADGGSGTVAVTLSNEENAWSNLTYFYTNTSYTLTYNNEVSSDSDTIDALLSSTGVLSVETELDEEVDGDFAWRFPPHLVRFQKAKNTDLFMTLAEDAGVRYVAVDTNDDNVKDALDPSQREGDEVFRGIEMAVKKPAGASVADLTGDFGRIYLGVRQNVAGLLEVETERNQLSFDGTGYVDISAADYRLLESNHTGESAYSTDTLDAETDIAITMSSGGDILTIGGENTDGFVNEDFDFLVINEIETTDDSNASDDQYQDVYYSINLAVKLPDQQLDLTNKIYRVLFLGFEFDGTSVALNDTRFDTELNITSTTTGTLNGSTSSISKDNPVAEVVVDTETVTDAAVTISLDSNGAMSLTHTDEDNGVLQMDGFMNHDGSLGIFHTTYTPDGESTIEQGVMILMEI